MPQAYITYRDDLNPQFIKDLVTKVQKAAAENLSTDGDGKLIPHDIDVVRNKLPIAIST